MSARSIRRSRLRRLAALTAGAGALSPAPALADSVVTNTANAGPGSLRQAIIDSNAGPSQDTVTFAPGVNGTITLSGEIPIIHGTAIRGPGVGALTVSATSTRALFFNPASASTLELEGLTLSGKSVATPGGAVAAICPQQSSVVLRNAAITGSTATDRGAGLLTDGCDVAIAGSSFTGNSVSGAVADGGAMLIRDGAGGGTADGLTITDSRISGNTALEDGGGVQVEDVPGPVSVARTTFAGNMSLGGCGCGGGMFLDDVGGPITIDSSTFAGNVGTGGSVLVGDQNSTFLMRNSTITGNTGSGGGIYFENDSGTVARIENSTIVGNGGDLDGGGVYFFGNPATSDLLISSSIVAGNMASRSGPDLHTSQSGSGEIFVDNSLIGSTAGGAVTELTPGTSGPTSVRLRWARSPTTAARPRRCSRRRAASRSIAASRTATSRMGAASPARSASRARRRRPGTAPTWARLSSAT